MLNLGQRPTQPIMAECFSRERFKEVFKIKYSSSAKKSLKLRKTKDSVVPDLKEGFRELKQKSPLKISGQEEDQDLSLR